jgi:hypothetical protein
MGMMTGMGPFRVGLYQFELYTDSDLIPPPGRREGPGDSRGGFQQAAQFKVNYPTCPVAFALPSVECKGYYKDGQQCRGPNKNQTCTCNGMTGVWDCP